MTVSQPNMSVIKYADDTVILELCEVKQQSLLQAEMSNIATWCEKNSLLINASKTKEVVFCNKRDDPNPSLINMCGAEIQRVDEYKYLGTILNNKLCFKANTSNIVKKASQRLHIIKQLAFLHAKANTIQLCFSTFIESVLSYHLAIIYGHLSQDDKRQYNQVLKTANRLSRAKLRKTSIHEIYEPRFKAKCLRLNFCSRDPILEFELLPSGRHRTIKGRTNARKNSFRSNCAQLCNKIFK